MAGRNNSEAGFLLKAVAGVALLVAAGEGAAGLAHAANLVQDNGTKISSLGQGDQAALSARITKDSKDMQDSFEYAVLGLAASGVIFVAGSAVSGSSGHRDRRITR